MDKGWVSTNWIKKIRHVLNKIRRRAVFCYRKPGITPKKEVNQATRKFPRKDKTVKWRQEETKKLDVGYLESSKEDINNMTYRCSCVSSPLVIPPHLLSYLLISCYPRHVLSENKSSLVLSCHFLSCLVMSCHILLSLVVLVMSCQRKSNL